MTTTKPNPYDRRQNKMSKQDIARMGSKWIEQQPNAAQRAATISEQRRAFWDGLHAYLRNLGGAITSVPYSSPVRIELPVEKAMIGEKLRELGYDLADRGNESRVGGTQAYYTVRVYELRLPK
jgi:hypothetical protein